MHTYKYCFFVVVFYCCTTTLGYSGDYHSCYVSLIMSTVTTIATKWRKYIARKNFLALKSAANTIAANYKRLMVQRYVKKYRHAVAITRKFIIGFMNRNKPKCPENIYVSVCVCACVHGKACHESVS